MRLVKSLAHRSFALLWLGQTISRLGDSLYRVALAWWVLEKTGSAVAMATVFIFTSAPLLVFLLLGGVIVDRLPRLHLMLASDLLRGLVMTIVAILAFTRQLEIWHIYVASLLFGSLDAFFEPAYTAVMPELIPPEALPSANSLTGLSRQLSGIVGPAIGATAVALGGTSVAFGLDAVSFFISAACLVPILATSLAPSNSAASSGILKDLREGIATVLGRPWLWITIAVAALANVTQSPFNIAMPFLIKEKFQAEVGLLGWIYSLSSLGSVLASVWLGRLIKIRRRGWLAYGGWLISGLAVFSIGLPIGIGGVLVSAFIYGATLAIFGLIWTNSLQELVPRERLGRVASIDYLGSFVMLPVGYGIAGWATDWLGASLVFIIGGGLTMLLVGLGLSHPAIRHLD